jgi:hypothetical protein
LRSLLARLLSENSTSIELENTNDQYGIETIMTIANATPFGFRFVDTKQRVLLELTNKTEMTMKSIEILTVFLKDEETPGEVLRKHIFVSTEYSLFNQRKRQSSPIKHGLMASRQQRSKISSADLKLSPAPSSLMCLISHGRMSREKLSFKESPLVTN